MAYDTYTVKRGDSLSKIAKQLGLGSWRELYELNKSVIGSNPSLIYSGQTYNIPGTNVPAPTQTPPPAPVQTPAPAQETLSRQYTNPFTGQLERAAELPQFENLTGGSFKNVWGDTFAQPTSELAVQQIRPEYERMYERNAYDYLNNLYGQGGQRMGTGPGGGIGNVRATSNRAYSDMYNDWMEQQYQNLYQNWYERARQSWNEGRTQANFESDADLYKIPTLM